VIGRLRVESSALSPPRPVAERVPSVERSVVVSPLSPPPEIEPPELPVLEVPPLTGTGSVGVLVCAWAPATQRSELAVKAATAARVMR
jgi:hypothetical protein